MRHCPPDRREGPVAAPSRGRNLSADRLPTGCVYHRAGATHVWARRERINLVTDLIRESGTLAAAARAAFGSSQIRGRGIAHVFPVGDGRPWLVRTLRHGGVLRSVTRGLFCRLSGNRPLNELWLAGELARMGIPTPPVIAAVVHQRGPFYRGEVAREYVDASGDLAEVLFLDPSVPSRERIAACRAAGALVAQMHRAGLFHPDLNLRNVLILPATGEKHMEAWILDLEKCRLGPGSGARLRRRMLRRLRHSATRFASATGRPLPREYWSAFQSAYEETLHAG